MLQLIARQVSYTIAAFFSNLLVQELTQPVLSLRILACVPANAVRFYLTTP